MTTLLAVTAIPLVGCAPGGAGDPVTAVAGLTFDAPAAGLPVTMTDATGATVTVSSTERILPVNGDLGSTRGVHRLPASGRFRNRIASGRSPHGRGLSRAPGWCRRFAAITP